MLNRDKNETKQGQTSRRTTANDMYDDEPTQDRKHKENN